MQDDPAVQRLTFCIMVDKVQVTLRLRLEAAACLVVSWYNSARKPALSTKTDAWQQFVVKHSKGKSNILTWFRLLQLVGRVPVMLLTPRFSWSSCSTDTQNTKVSTGLPERS